MALRASEVLNVEPNVIGRLGLTEALGMQRMRGLHGMLYRRATPRAKCARMRAAENCRSPETD